MTFQKDKQFHRSVEIANRAINEDERTVEIAFSSESVVERYYGTEVLDHSSDSVRLGRLNNGGAFLMEHNRNDQIGVVERAWIDEDKVGRATVKFSKSQRANEIFEDVKDGIRRLVSVGYRIHGEEIKKLDGGREAVRAIDWEPYELSLVSIPADDSVGVGRTMENSTDKPKIENTMSEVKDENKSAPVNENNRSVEVINEPQPRVDVANERKTAVDQERARISGITSVAEAAKTRGLVLDANKAISDGMSADEFRTAAFEKLVEKKQNYHPAADLSRSEQKDLDKFDLSKALRSRLGSGKLDGVERELIDEGIKEARTAGIPQEGGIMLPSFYVKRDMTATGGSGGDQGGMTIATQKAGLLDDFFNSSVISNLGATVMTGLTGNLDIPRLLQDTDPAGKAENAASDELAPTTTDLNLAPNRLPAHVNISKQLIMQSSSAIEAVVRNHVTAQMLAVQERAFFHGTGTNEAEGIAGTDGIGSVIGGDNGAIPNYSDLIALRKSVAGQNAFRGSLAYVSNTDIEALFMETPKQSLGAEGNFVLGENGRLVGMTAEFTNAVRNNLDKGTAIGDCSAIFFGNFNDYFIGYWGGLMLDVMTDATLATQGKVRLIGETYYDGGVQRPKSFAAMLDALLA